MVVAVSLNTSLLVLTWAAILLLACAMAGILRQVRLLQLAAVPPRVGPPPGALFEELPAWPDSNPTAVVFLEEDCPSCDNLRLKLPELTRRMPETHVVEVFPHLAVAGSLPDVPVIDDSPHLFQKYNIRATPFGVLVARDGTILASAPLGSPAALEGLVVSANGTQQSR